MCKKLFCTTIIFIMLIVFSIPAMAYPLVDESSVDITVSGSSTKDPLKQPLSKKAENKQGNESNEVEKDPFEKLLADIIKDNDIKETEQFLATITNNDTVFKKLYLICGYAEEKNIGAILARYNEEKGVYEEYLDTDGESRWDIGDSGLFTKEIELKKGENKLKFIIYKKPLVESSKSIENEDRIAENAAIENEKINLEEGKNLQISFFTVNVLDESVKDKLINSVTKITDIFKNDIVNKIFQSK